MTNRERTVGTHDGSFHADEVTACALLLLFGCVDRDKIIRTRDLAKLATCEYVCDVGGIYDPAQKRFDHHQVDYQGSFSSAGMVLSYLHDQQVLTVAAYDFFNQTLILGVDAHDNGHDLQIKGVTTYSMIIANFTPLFQDASAEEQNHAFEEALNFANSHLNRLWDRYQYTFSCREIVKEAMAQESSCLMFDKAIPWMDSFFELGGLAHPAHYMIMPSGTHWKLRGIPPSLDDRMRVRSPLPEKWAGLMGDDLKKATGISGAIFCHKGRFISVWETREDALKAWELATHE